jgi:hypothetical protein
MPGRDNGFVARHYVPLADLDPRLADAMLDVLRGEGIAAYVEPSSGHLGGYLEVHLPERPRDRLWVDRERHEHAAALLSAHTEQPSDGPAADHGQSGAQDDPVLGFDATAPQTSDDVWAQLVASYDAPSQDDTPRWPAAEDLPTGPDAAWRAYEAEVDGQPTLPLDLPSSPDSAANPTAHPPVRRRIVRPAESDSPLVASTPDDAPPVSGEYDPLSILDEHFVPPTPPPVPRLRPATRWALAAIVAGIAVIVARSFLDWIPDAVALGVLGIVGGFVGLVALMGESRPSDSGPDDGAVV